MESKWKEVVKNNFKVKDIEEKEKKTTAVDIPRERKGVFPTKEYEMKEHLESCPKQEGAGEQGGSSFADNMEIPPKIISGNCGRMMEFLGE